jgi:hypothetical protein
MMRARRPLFPHRLLACTPQLQGILPHRIPEPSPGTVRTKAELSDLLDKRDLPKTDTVDELIERLVEADSK